MKTSGQIKKWWGYKLFKEVSENNFEISRIIKIHEFNNQVTLLNEETGATKKVAFESLSEYTPLEPYGVIGFSIVKCYTNAERTEYQKDVLVSLYKMIDLQIRNNVPYCLCRQSITDFFYSIISGDDNPDTQVVGVSVTQESCPSNIPFETIAACDDVVKFDMVHVYRDDNLDSILKCINVKEYDQVLAELFRARCRSLDLIKSLSIEASKESYKGWCKNLRRLLIENNFMTDFDTMCGATAVDFKLADYLVETCTDDIKNIGLNDEALQFFNQIFSVNAVSTTAIEFGYDIDLAEFNNSNYTFLRDSDNRLYIIVYTTDGEYLEKDLEDESNKMDVSTKLRLSFYKKAYEDK